MSGESHVAESAKLPRVLGPVEAFCVIVGSVIGSGIFIVPAEVARDVPYIGGIVLVWVIGGMFSAAGAMTLAELGAMMPRAGGLYVYLRAAYGTLPAFLFGWTELLIMRTGSMATLAAAFARYFAQLVPAPGNLRDEVWQAAAAVTAIAVVTAINVLGTSLGGHVQVAGTALKVGGMLVLITLPLAFGGAHVANLSPVMPDSFSVALLGGMMAAMVGVLWAYDGWVNLTSLAEEVRDPGRNLPRALIFGMGALIVIYLSMTIAYHLVLPLPDVAAASTVRKGGKAVAALYCHRLVGERGVWAISFLVMCSTFISLNGNALTGPRAYFAMARDGLFPMRLCRVSPRFQTPANSILAQGTWAIILTVVGTALIVLPAPGPDSGLPGPIHAAWIKLNKTPLYTLLYTYVIFGATLFNILAIASVFVLRVKRPDLPRPYRAWGYPFTPSLFLVAALLLMGDMLRQKPAESLAGLLIVSLGLPAYLVFLRKSPPTLDEMAGA
jgi:APA family basic amino acid/polyamine antiporter